MSAALEFFEERVGAVQLLWRGRLRCVDFAVPPQCLALPSPLRAQVEQSERPQLPAAQVWAATGANAHAHLRDFCRRCRVLHQQIEFQRTLHHYALLLWFSARYSYLLLLQAALALAVNVLRLIAPADDL